MNVSLEIIEDAAYFCYPPEYDTCVEEFDRLLDERESGRVGEKRYIDRLKDLAKRYPWFIDAHAHIGNVLLYNGRTKQPLMHTGRASRSAKRPSPQGTAA